MGFNSIDEYAERILYRFTRNGLNTQAILDRLVLGVEKPIPQGKLTGVRPFVCPVCEDRKRKHRERVARLRRSAKSKR